MVSSQLLDYVRQQLAAGIPKEELSKSLITSGWQVSDINEAFASISPSPSTQMPVQNSVQHTVSSHKGMMAVVIVLLLLVGAGGVYAAYHYGLFTPPTTSEPATSNTDIVSPPSGLLSYSNKVFSNFFPEGWTTEEEVLSSYGCSARVYFVQNSVPKQTLINESTDYLHYLANPGSVISVSGGVGEQGTVSFENLKNSLVNVEKDGRTIKLSFFQENVVETDHKLDINNSSPSLTYYFEFPKYNKKGIAKSVVLNGKYPQIVSIYYIAPEKDFSEDVFNSIVSSAKNNLTTNRCDPFESSSVKKDQKITITLPADKTWKENNTYTVSWSTDLPSSSFSYFYVQLGSDIPKRVAANPGSYGLWKVDKTKNSFEIKLNKNIINEQLNNSSSRNFESIKNTFFIRVTAFNEQTPAWNANPSADSSLFSIAEPVATPIANPQNEQDAMTSIANIMANVANFRPLAETVYNSNSSYASICSGGLINVNANASFPVIVKGILNYQGVSDQSSAGIVCVATKDKYALEVTFKKYSSTRGIHSYCVDSSGISGDDTKYKIDQASFSCKPQ